jgi:hypothetical protein
MTGVMSRQPRKPDTPLRRAVRQPVKGGGCRTTHRGGIVVPVEQPILRLTVTCDCCGTPFDVVFDVDAAMQMAEVLPEGMSTVTAICPTCRANQFSERHWYTAVAGDRVRIAIPYGDVWRHIFWVRVSPAGDVYCSFGYGDDHIVKAETGDARSEAGRVRVNYGDERREVVGKLKGGRISFHVSGQINLADLQFAGIPLAERTEQEILGVMVFEHPSAFPPMEAIGSRDIVLPFDVREDRALVGVLQFAPSASQVRFEPGVLGIGEPLRELVIRFEGVTGSATGEVALYVALARGPQVEEWPPMSHFVVGSNADN